MTATTDPLDWARDHMPIHRSLATEYGDTQPFDGTTVAVASHLEANTGVLIETLHAAGAEVLFTPSEPHSTHGDVVAYLDGLDGITAFASEDMTDAAFAEAHHALLEHEPDLILDDGCELIAKLHADHPDIAQTVRGGAEQTTAGVHRLEAMADDRVLAFPVYAVNDTPMKHWFDNVHGTGESALTNLAITTNSIIAGSCVVVAGYGHVGRGIATKARALGARTIVTEVDPRKAVAAHMDGHRTMAMTDAVERGDVFVTATGTRDVIRREHFDAMHDGATLCNAGHFDVEIDTAALADQSDDTSEPIDGITRYHLPDGRRLNLLSDGRLVNLTGPHSKGHPAEVMDTTFAMMFEAARDLLEADREPGLHAVPDRLDRAVAERKLETLGATVDEPTAAQRDYRDDWRAGF